MVGVEFMNNLFFNKFKERKIIVLFVGTLLLALIAILVYNYSVRVEPIISFVSGTEYISGESGQVIVRISNRDGRAIMGFNCTSIVLYPNKTYFLFEEVMQRSQVAGNYYISFTTPTTVGIYEETVTCVSNNGEIYTTSSSFHVSLAMNLVQQIAINQMHQYGNITEKLNKTLFDVNLLALQVDNARNMLEERMNETQRELDKKITQTVDGKFQKFYNDTAKAYKAMGDIFSE